MFTSMFLKFTVNRKSHRVTRFKKYQRPVSRFLQRMVSCKQADDNT